ncbi:conserved protein of unknown function [Hyphomicrobium sp. 1Nfss2.1]|uniref:hypothetical protein n=1 Tax=Hyphomicrobium sp. 1Nfss2.1 TaxID=3413936 RepID=UPI003C799006
MQQNIIQTVTPSEPRAWHRHFFIDHAGHVYRVSFRIGEQATWDHRFHELDGRELAADELALSSFHLWFIQVSCDAAVGAKRVTFAAPANVNLDADIAC